MIIDCNVHITEDGKWFHTPHDASLAKLLENVKEAGIDHAMAVPLPGVITNEAQEKLIAKNDHIISACTFNPALYNSAQDAAAAYTKEFSVRKKTLVKFHNRFGKYHPNDERFLAVLKANDRLEQPMLIGVCGLLHDRNTTSSVNTAGYFFDVAQKLNDTELVIMHGGGTDILRVAEMCRDLHHVYFDLSMTLSKYRHTSVEGDIRWLCHHYDRRMIWGSDFPETNIKKALNDLRETVGEIAPEKWDNITGRNIHRLLGLS